MEATGAPAEIRREVFCLGPDTVKSAVPAECFSVYRYLPKAAVESLPFLFLFSLSIHLFPNAI